MVKCPVGLADTMRNVVAAWETTTGFVTEVAQYRSWHARDVNAYIAVGVDGKVKSKNIFYDPWRGVGAKDAYWRFQKNPAMQICAEAVERLLVEGVPLEQTVRGCSDVRRFLAVKNVTGGAHKNGDYLGKVVRWIYCKDSIGTINYVSNSRIVADTEGAFPLMDLPEIFPDNIDYDWYIRRANDMMKDCGYSK